MLVLKRAEIQCACTLSIASRLGVTCYCYNSIPLSVGCGVLIKGGSGCLPEKVQKALIASWGVGSGKGLLRNSNGG